MTALLEMIKKSIMKITKIIKALINMMKKIPKKKKLMKKNSGNPFQLRERKSKWRMMTRIQKKRATRMHQMKNKMKTPRRR